MSKQCHHRSELSLSLCKFFNYCMELPCHPLWQFKITLDQVSSLSFVKILYKLHLINMPLFCCPRPKWVTIPCVLLLWWESQQKLLYNGSCCMDLGVRQGCILAPGLFGELLFCCVDCKQQWWSHTCSGIDSLQPLQLNDIYILSNIAI